ncbi:MAG TPA: hypothetical protein VEK80_16835 [Kribbellaceae bacterium]|nr:hypothetical protein [Kribbellaceae bacterium]
MSAEEIDEKFTSEVNGIAKELNKREGQANRDIERINEVQIQEFRDEKWVDLDVRPDPKQPKVLGVVPADVIAKELTTKVVGERDAAAKPIPGGRKGSDPHVKFEATNIDEQLDSDAVKSLAGRIRAQSMIPAAPE